MVDSPDIPLMPDLRIVRIADLVPHEEHDMQRSEPLMRRIQEAGVWMNPPVVTEMGDGRYLILDGANRHFSLDALGYPYILVQVVDYESVHVRLETWHHVVSELSWFEFLRTIREMPGLTVERHDLLSARAALARRRVLAYTVLGDDSAYTMHAAIDTLSEQTHLLRDIVDTYKSRCVLNRINTDAISEARRLYPSATAIVVFPRFEPVEILDAARENIPLPPGITRHIIMGRAMRINYPLDHLRENGETLDAKNDALQSWIQGRVAEKRVRFYAESTFLFDE
jgi:L-serine kinase (ATP) / ParB family transcriptional regulator, heme-responsive regulator